MLRLFRHRLPLPRQIHASLRFFSSGKPEKDDDIVQRLLSQAEEFRQELRHHIIASPSSRELQRNIISIDQSVELLNIRRKKLEGLYDIMMQKPDLVSLEVLSNGTTHIRPCVCVRTPHQTYLFNCPEGTSRFLPSLRIRPQTIQDFFITRATWDCIGGLFGVLLNKETPDHVTHLHGPQRIKLFLESVRPFADSDFGGDQIQKFRTEEVSYDKGMYEDVAMRIHYIPVHVTNPEISPNAPESHKFTDIAYLMELKEPNKRVDILKLAKLKVPKGPLIGKLKGGESITLDDGTIIRPEDVYAEDSTDHAANVLVVDCDSIEKLESLVTNSLLLNYTEGRKQMGYIVHMTVNSILKQQKYQEWMQSFGLRCLHLIANGSGEVLPVGDGPYRQQRMLNEICPELFPSIYPNDFHGTLTQDVSPPPPSTNLIHVKPLGKYPMRATKAAVNNDAITISLAEPELAERISEQATLPDVIQAFRQKVDSLSTSSNYYPCVAFLGTASAVPTKYRNVSAYWLQLKEDVSLLVDCGEGTFGQLMVLNGPDKINDALIGLSAIFVTHAHLDHIGGINSIIEHRVQAFREKGLPYKPLILACNVNVRKLLTLYRCNFRDLDQYIQYVNVGIYVKNSADFTGYDRNQLVSDVAKFLPKELYSPDKWNLKAAHAVQVHHTRMASGFVFDTYDGKRFVFSGDTMPCKLLAEVGKDADLMIHEATFEDGFERDALRKKHSTTGQAIDIGKRMNAKLIVMTHFSARYPRVPAISTEMLQLGNVGVAFDNLVLPFSQHKVLPLMLPLLQKVFLPELDDLAIREMQRTLRTTLDKQQSEQGGNKPNQAGPSEKPKDVEMQDGSKSSDQSEGEEMETDEPIEQTMSKSELRRKRKFEFKLEQRKQKREEEKKRRKEKRQALREAGKIDLLKAPTFYEMAKSKCPITVAVDMSYQSLMNETLIRKTISQLNYCYGVNRRNLNPLQYHIAHLNGLTKQIFEGYPGYKDWDVYMHEESVAELWAAKNVVYLTSESENVLTDLEPNKTYIIGGLLDHNSYKGASLIKAKQQGFEHARLPIDEYVKLNSRRVLTINHVFEIMLRYWETKDWEKAFFDVIPKRKGIESLGASSSQDIYAPPPKTNDASGNVAANIIAGLLGANQEDAIVID